MLRRAFRQTHSVDAYVAISASRGGEITQRIPRAARATWCAKIPSARFASLQARRVGIRFFNDGATAAAAAEPADTSMRDLAVHGDDLIVRTHDARLILTTLRRCGSERGDRESFGGFVQAAKKEGGSFSLNRNTDTPLPPIFLPGRIRPTEPLRYYLGAVQQPVTLEVLDRGQSFGSPLLQQRQAGGARENRGPPIPSRCIGCVLEKFYPAEAACIVLCGICTTPRQKRSTANSRFPPLFTTLRSSTWAWAMPGKYAVKLTVDGNEFSPASLLSPWTRVSKRRKRFAETI